MQPCKPASNGVPKPILIGLLLMKPAGAFKQPANGLHGRSRFSSGTDAATWGHSSKPTQKIFHAKNVEWVTVRHQPASGP